MYDVCIIGGGVIGCAIARELSRYQVNACVVEKCEDVCCGTSKANSAIIHAGFDAAEGSLKAKLNVEGNKRMEQLAEDLDFPFRRNGSLVVCMDKEELPGLQALYDRGIKNGVPELRILSREEVLEMEPNLSDEVQGALYAPTGGIVCPFHMTIALAENANANGVEFRFDTEVTEIKKEDGYYRLETNKGMIETCCVVNAAGVYADVIHNMVSENKIRITARRGDYFLLDHSVGGYVSHTVFPLPTKLGKGVLISPTIHGNLIVGPTAIDVENKEAVNTTREGLEDLMLKAGMTVKNPPLRQVITSFAGLRAHEAGNDFIIQEAEDADGFFDAAGIESPGLSSAPAIGVMAAGMLRDKLGLVEKTDFLAVRKGILNPSNLSMEKRNELIRQQPAYGTIICRCESVTEGEILDAIHRPIGAKSLDGIKRRTRAGMGRCQAGFCSPRIMEILERELHMRMEDITKSGGASVIVTDRTKLQEQEG